MESYQWKMLFYTIPIATAALLPLGLVVAAVKYDNKATTSMELDSPREINKGRVSLAPDAGVIDDKFKKLEAE
jgi:hypothetical protein